MRILIVNPPHPSIGSRIPHEHLPPLGLLQVGGALLDAGHATSLLDADLRNLSTAAIVRESRAQAPDAILLGHSGSTSAHPGAARIARALREAHPRARIVYGGVFPTYHWRDILDGEPAFDVIVRGEGEATAPRLLDALERDLPLETVPGIAFRRDGRPFATPRAAPIRDLDACRTGWELVDLGRYSYWGDLRAVVMQFSRGCPHRCSYCGQRGFWTRWRHRDPRRFAAEIAWLHRTRGVEVFNLADENPTASRAAWQAFLEALIAEGVKVKLVGSTRASDIVRDRDILHLYRRAGVERWLLGTESTDEATLARIRKGATTTIDRQAIESLRAHDILAMATWVVGFEEERDGDYLRGLRQLLAYDPDQVQLLYATPHRWTPLYRQEAARRVIQTDRSRWDYKHQVLATRHVPAWRVLLWVKLIEAVLELRPRALARLLGHRDRAIRAAQRWYYRIGRRVWFHEIASFLFRERRETRGPRLDEFWGPPQDAEEEALARPPAGSRAGYASVSGRSLPRRTRNAMASMRG